MYGFQVVPQTTQTLDVSATVLGTAVTLYYDAAGAHPASSPAAISSPTYFYLESAGGARGGVWQDPVVTVALNGTTVVSQAVPVLNSFPILPVYVPPVAGAGGGITGESLQFGSSGVTLTDTYNGGQRWHDYLGHYGGPLYDADRPGERDGVPGVR